ncbi:MAG: hypothetical protein LUQ03_02150 [Methanomicrobiales archaeon]|nr:hypothetical protein [Methanomicrobiales archaeon]
MTSTDATAPTWVTLPVTASGLTRGNTYYVILKTASSDQRNYYYVPLNKDNPYRDGSHFKNTIGSINAGSDMLVKVTFTG